MASVSGIRSSVIPSPLKLTSPHLLFRRLSLEFPPPRSSSKPLSTTHSLARDVSIVKKGLVKDPQALWVRFVEWLYQHKELGLYIDVSRVGFTDEFVEEMEPKFQAAFKAMKQLEKGAIANPDEGRMVGHYWLRNSNLAPTSRLKTQIDRALESVSTFAQDVISGKIKPPSSPEGRFTQILSVGIGGSALGPQFVAEALAPDNPPLRIRFIDNTDPAGIDHQIAQLGDELSSTLVIVISKVWIVEWRHSRD